MILPGFPALTSRRPSILFIASAVSSGSTITIPAAARAGDLCVVADLAIGGPPSAVVAPGYTQVGSDLNASSGSVKNIVSGKVLGSGDPGGTITGMDGSAVDQKIALVFRPRQGSWQAAIETGAQAAAGAITNQIIGAGTAPYVAFGVWGGNVTPARGFSPAADGEVDAGSLFVRWKIFNQGPAAITLTCDSGAGGWRILRSFGVPLTL